MEDKEDYDASMTIDVKAWTLLQSTHKKLLRIPPLVEHAHLLLCLAVGFYGYVLSAFFIFYLFCAAEGVRNERLYGEVARQVNEVARQVNEALQQDGERSHLAVEFHTSGLPGRNTPHSKRYQFVVLMAQSDYDGVPVVDSLAAAVPHANR